MLQKSFAKIAVKPLISLSPGISLNLGERIKYLAIIFPFRMIPTPRIHSSPQ